ncbi:MAG TPA: DUF4880 domain-containing protein [Pseudomonas sp.]|uniref:DUF4880 domain-containing protein n=1 Tax=Pseudomonas sp. TaxID=306 RepID=UPI002ED9585B
MTGQFTSLFTLPSRQPDTPLSQECDELRRRIQRLPRRTQQIFLLSRLDRLSYFGIGQLLEISTAAVERSMVRLLEHCTDRTQGSNGAARSLDPVTSQARRWYIHLQSPQATASQRIEFRHWLDADTRHLAAFEATEHLWRRLEAPARVLGASGWHLRKRRVYIGWLLLTAFLCSLLVTAEAISSLP